MKKIIGALLAILVVLSGCSNSNRWVGTWQNESCKEAVIEGPNSWEDSNGKCTLTINEDGTGTLSIQNTTLKSFVGTYSIHWTLNEEKNLKLISDDFTGIYIMKYQDEDAFTLLVDRYMGDGYSPGHLQFIGCEKQ